MGKFPGRAVSRAMAGLFRFDGMGNELPILLNYKCQACGARFFDDEAMHVIQAARSVTKDNAPLPGRRNKAIQQ